MEHGRDLLRAWMKRSRLTWAETAPMLGISYVFLTQLLSGSRLPSLETAIRIADVTGVPVERWGQKSISGTPESSEATAENVKVSQ